MGANLAGLLGANLDLPGVRCLGDMSFEGVIMLLQIWLFPQLQGCVATIQLQSLRLSLLNDVAHGGPPSRAPFSILIWVVVVHGWKRMPLVLLLRGDNNSSEEFKKWPLESWLALDYSAWTLATLIDQGLGVRYEKRKKPQRINGLVSHARAVFASAARSVLPNQARTNE